MADQTKIILNVDKRKRRKIRQIPKTKTSPHDLITLSPLSLSWVKLIFLLYLLGWKKI